MTQRMEELAAQIVRLQAELDREIEARRKGLGWHIKEGMVEFERGIAIEHRRLRLGVGRFLARSPLGAILTGTGDLFGCDPALRCRHVGEPLSGHLLSGLPHPSGPPLRLHRHRPQSPALSERHRGFQLRLLRLRQRRARLYPRNRQPHRTVLVPDQARLQGPGPHHRYYEFLEYGDADGYRARLEEFRKKLREEEKAAAAAKYRTARERQHQASARETV